MGWCSAQKKRDGEKKIKEWIHKQCTKADVSDVGSWWKCNDWLDAVLNTHNWQELRTLFFFAFTCSEMLVDFAERLGF